MINRVIPNKRKNVCKLLRHPFIVGDSPNIPRNINLNLFTNKLKVYENSEMSKIK